jgi:hypothetical protein
MKSFFTNLNDQTKYYLINTSLVLIVLLSMGLMFFTQFNVEALQNKADGIETKISTFEDEIRVLEVEWVYLTRPQRLRMLSTRYIKSNSYIASNQIKDTNQLQKYYTASLEERQQKDLAMGR